ncbi:MAG: PKD-like domain-containing protein [Cyclobacteriaceae bacterium]
MPPQTWRSFIGALLSGPRVFGLISLFLALVLVSGRASAQCGLTNLNPQYCVDQPAFTLTGGTNYYGPGVSGSTFDPAAAGVGFHTLITTDGNAAGYFVNTTGTFSPITGSGTALALGNDDEATGVPIGFTFNFFGFDHTQLRVGSNGILGFTDAVTTPTNQTLPDATNPNNIIAASWDDMLPDGSSSIEYFTTGSAPFRRFIVNYNNLQFLSSSNRITVQVQLHETTNIIEIHSSSITAGADEKTQGIEGPSGAVAYFVAGRNFNNFTAANDFVQFRPQCLDIRSVTINGLPSAALAVSPASASICPSQTVNVTITGDQSGVEYQLQNSVGSVPLSGFLPGDGVGNLVITSDPIAANTTIKVYARTIATGCDVDLSATSVITVVAPPAAPAIVSPAGPVVQCQGTGAITLTSNTPGGTASYQWFKDGTPIGGATAISYIVPDLASSTGSYSVAALGSGPTLCSSAQSATLAVTIHPLPGDRAVTPASSTSICSGGTVALTIALSQIGINYEVIDNLSNVVSGTLAGTGADLTIATNALSTGSSLRVRATNSTTLCTFLLDAADPITINPIPGVPSITSPAGPVVQCEGSGNVILTSDTPPGTATYQWYRNGIAIGGATSISYTVVDNAANSGTYTVSAVGVGSTFCSSAQSAALSVTINAQPLDRTVTPTSSTTTCSGGTVTLQVSSSQSGINYEIVDQSSNVVSGIVVGTGGNVNITTTALTPVVTSLRVRGTNASTSCTRLLDAADGVTVNAIPAALTIAPAGPVEVCEGSSSVLLTASAGAGYQWYLNGSQILGATASTYSIATIPGNSGNYTVTQTVSGCTSAPSAAVSVTINALPLTSPAVSPASVSVCEGSTTTITVTGSQAGINYQLFIGASPVSGLVAGGGAINITSNALTASGTLSVRATNPVTTCTVLLSGTTTLTVNPIPGVPSISSPAGPVVQCEGSGNVILTSDTPSGTATYQWYRNGIAIGGATSISYTVVDNAANSGTYTVSAVGVGSTFCSSAQSAGLSVTINAQPLDRTVTPTSSTTICSGGTVTLQVAASQSGINYAIIDQLGIVVSSLTPGTGGNINISTVPLGLSVTGIRVRAINPITGCVRLLDSADPIFLFPNPGTPTITSHAGLIGQCQGTGNIILISNVPPNTASFQWYRGGLPIVGAIGSSYTVVDLPANSGTYAVQAIGIGPPGCTSALSASVQITITPPMTAVAGMGATYCQGVPVNLGGSPTAVGGDGNYSYSWVSVPPGFTSTLSNPVVTPPVGVTRYDLTVTDGNGCVATDAVFINVSPTPAAPTAADPTPICVGATNPTITATGGGGATFNWYDDSNLTNLVFTGAAFTSSVNAAAGTYLFYVTQTIATCEGPATVVNVRVNPAITADAGNPAVICNGQPVTLGGSPSAVGGSGSYTYAWTSVPPGFTSSLSNPVVSPSATTTYQLSVTDPNGCSSIDHVVITVNPVPDLAVTPDQQSICNGGAANIVASSTLSGALFTWTVTQSGVSGASDQSVPGSGSIAQNLTLDVSNLPGTATYTIQSVSPAGCVSPAQVVIVNVLPIPDAQALPVTICSGQNANVFIDNPNNVTGTTFSWTALLISGSASGFGPGNGNTINQILTTTPPGNGVVRYTITPSAFGCVGTAVTVDVTVNPRPVLSSSLTPSAICSGSVFSYTATSGTAGASFAWSRAAVGGIQESASSGSGDVSETLTNLTTAPINVTYVYTVTANGCAGPSQNVVVTVNPNPVLSSSLTPPSICSGSTFSYAPASGTPGATFNWSRAAVGGITPVGPTSGTNNPNEALTNTTSAPINVTYQYTISANGCSTVQNVVVTVNPTPVLTSPLTAAAICSGSTFGYTATSSTAGATFSWSRAVVVGIAEAAGSGTGNVSEVLTNTTTAPVNVTYAYTVSANGCTNASVFSVVVTVNPSANFNVTNAAASVCEGLQTSIQLNGSTTGLQIRLASVVATGGVTGFSASGTLYNSFPANITDNLSNPTNAPQTVTYTFEGSIGGVCVNPAQQTVIVTVNPAPPDLSITNLTAIVCPGTPNDITLNSVTSGAVITLTNVNYNGATGTLSNGTTFTPGSKITETLGNSTSSAIVVTYTFQVAANGCTNPVTQSTTVTVKPQPVFSIVNAASAICSGAAVDITLNTPTAGGVVRLDAVSYGGVTGGTAVAGSTFTNGQKITDALVNATVSPITVTYTFSVSSPLPLPACSNPVQQTVQVVVSPSPTMSIANTSPVICNGALTNFTLNSTTSGAVIRLVSVNYGAATGTLTAGQTFLSGYTISETITNGTSGPVVVNYTFDVSANSCVNAGPFNTTVTVQPSAKFSASNGTPVLCEGVPTNVTIASSTVGQRVRIASATATGGVTGFSPAGTTFNSFPVSIANNLVNPTNAPQTVTYVLEGSIAGTCVNPVTQAINVTVNPAPPDLSIVNASSVVCAGTPNDITLNSATTGAIITLTAVNYNGATGTLSAGVTRTPGSKITETLINPTNAPITVDYTFQVSANGCTNPLTQSTQVTVKPNPTLSITNSAFVICSGSATNILFNSPTSGHQINVVSATYGLVTGGTVVPGTTTFVNGSVLAETLTNPTSAAIDVVYLFSVTTPAPAPACPLVPTTQSVTVRVLPTPSASATNITICSGATAVVPISAAPKNVPGTTFDWTITPSPNVSGAAVGNGSTINQQLTLTNSAVGTVVYHIIPTANGCSGPVHDLTVTVNPVATVNAGTDYQLCEPGSVPISGVIGGAATTGTWTIVSGAGSIGASSTALPNVTAVYTVAPGDFGGFVILQLQTHDPDAAGPCVAVADQVRIDINRRPVVTVPADYTVCEPASIALTGSLLGSASTGLWSVVTGAGTLTATNIVPGLPIVASANYVPDPADVGTVLTFRLTTNDPDGPSGPCVQEFDDINITINRSTSIAAGIDLAQCADIPSTQILGVVNYAPNGIAWSIQAGSGTISNPTIAQPNYIFNNPSEINTTVRLRITALDPDGAGPCTVEFDEMDLRINPLPVVVFNGLPGSMAENAAPVTLTGNQIGGLFTITPLTSNIGSTIQAPVDRAIFNPAAADLGLNTIRYTFTNANGCTNYTEQNVIVNPVTTVDFLLQYQIGFPPFPFVPPDGSGGYALCADVGTIKVVGVPDVSTGLTPTNFVAVGPGAAILNLRLSQTGSDYFINTTGIPSDTYFLQYTYTNSLGVTSPPFIRPISFYAVPNAAILPPTNNCIDNDIDLRDNSTMPAQNPFGNSIVRYDWNFGDGTSALNAGTVEDHDYNAPGNYSVSLTVTTNQQCSAIAVLPIKVGDLPVVDFNWAAICTNDSTRFTDQTDPGPVSNIIDYRWIFDDGDVLGPGIGTVPAGTHSDRTAGTFKDPRHNYVAFGTYDVTLTVNTDDGCTNSKTLEVSILTGGSAVAPNRLDPYTRDFETDAPEANGGWIPEGLNTSPPLAPPVFSPFSWTLSTPAGATINTAAGGSRSWWTGLNAQSYYPSESSAVNGPCFDLRQLDRPMISLDFWSDAERNLDGAVVQYSTDGGLNWAIVGPLAGLTGAQRDQGINWYPPDATIVSNPGQQLIGQYGWTDKTGSWKNARFNLDMVNPADRDQVRIRVAFASNNDNAPGNTFDGFAFDNVYVGEKQRTNLVEHFTNYNLAASVAGDTWLDNRLAEQFPLLGETDFFDIRYHIGFPTPDQFYQENSNDPDARSLFYGVSQPPSTIMDGRLDAKFTGNFTEITRVEIDRRALAAPVFKIRIDTIPTGNANTITPEVEALYLGTTTFTDPLLIQAALIETPVTTPSSETYRNVLRKQLFGGDGETVALSFDPIQPGLDTASVTRSRANVVIDVPVQNGNNLWMIAYVQNKLTKEIYQAGIFKVSGKVGQTIVGVVDEELPSTAVFRDLLVHPNPADDKFAFRSFHDMRGYQWKMSDQRGVIVKQGDFSQSMDGDTWVEVSELPNGVYTLLIASPDGETLYKRLVVMNRN